MVPSESKMLEITGSMARLSEVETLLLQKTGFPCVSANNAYEMCRALPNAAFMDMHARHASGAEMNILAAYGAAVGSAAARRADSNVKGFIGSSQDLTAPFFGASAGMGTMPHALVGYTGGDVLKAMQLFAESIPEAKSLIALVDYTGEEVTDSIRCAKWFYEDARLQDRGKSSASGWIPMAAASPRGWTTRSRSRPSASGWACRASTTSSNRCWAARRFSSIPTTSWSTRFAASSSARVSAAAIIHIRRALDAAGYRQATIVGSSGFDPQKCQIMGAARVPLDVVGTGSFLPATLTETYATADIIAYDGVKRVKVGREFLYDDK